MRMKREVIERLGTLGELVELFISTGRWWLIPMLGILAGAAILLMLLHAAEYVAPFVYSIF